MTETTPPASRRMFLAALAAGWPGLRAVRAQEPAPQSAPKGDDTTFSADVKVVNVLASVRDKKGQVVSTLGKDDFIVTEDGRSEVIRYFSRENDMPLILGLLVDTSGSQRRVLGQERTASYRFLDTVLRAAKDRTFIMHFDHDSELLQDLTSSRTDLQHALDQLDLPSDSRPQMRGSGNSGGGYPGGGQRRGGAGTTLYDAIYLASNDIMKKEQGRKAIILLTDGVDNGSKTFLNDAIEATQRADTIAYSILFADEQAYQQQPVRMGSMGGGRRGGMGRMPPPAAASNRPDGKKILERISRETGGAFYEVTKKLTIDDIFDRIQEQLRNQYSIGYTSDRTDSTGYRTIKVTTKQSGMTVQAREGYYPR